MGRSIEEPDDVFFLFEVANVDRAREFMSNPEAARARAEAGVVDADHHFIRDGVARESRP